VDLREGTQGIIDGLGKVFWEIFKRHWGFPKYPGKNPGKPPGRGFKTPGVGKTALSPGAKKKLPRVERIFGRKTP